MTKASSILKYIAALLFLFVLECGMTQDLRIRSVDFPLSFNTRRISAIAQDAHGNIWLSNGQGLTKYDGENFTRYSHEKDNPNSLLSDRIECILVDSEGIIWIGGFDAGLSRFDPSTETFIHFQHNEADSSTIRSNIIRSLVQDHEGVIWIGTQEGLDYLNPVTYKFYHHLDPSPESDVLNKEHIRALLVDRKGTLWAGSSGPFFGEETSGGLFRIDIASKKVKRYYHSKAANSLIDNRVTALFEDSKGNFWVGTAGDGLHKMNRDEGTFVRYQYDPEHPEKLSRPPLRELNFAVDHIRFITEDDQGFIWIGTFGMGINRYNPKDQTVQFFGTTAQGSAKLPADIMWAGFKTLDGLMWFTSFNQSSREKMLFNINLTPEGIYQRELGKPVFAFEEGEDGSIFMGSNNELIQIDKNGKESVVLQFDPSIPNRLNHLNMDSSGNLWISSETGLFKYDISADSVHTYHSIGDKSTTPEVLTTEIIDENRILLGTVEGLYLLDENQEEITKLDHSLDQVNSKNRYGVEKIFKDSRNNIWLGIANIGLKRFDIAKEEFIDYPFAESVQNFINDIYEDEDQNLYIGGMQSGIRKYNPETDQFSAIIDESGLLTEITGIGGINGSGDSILWIATGSEMIKYNVKTNTGFPFDIYNWIKPGTRVINRGIFKSSQGDLYGSVNNGFTRLSSEDFERKSEYKPTPFVSKFQVNNQLISLKRDVNDEKLSFNHDQNNISITLGYINFLTGFGENEVKYRLENYDSDWRVGKNGHEITYYGLSRGKYTLRSKVLDKYGELTEDTLTFSIKPPWWQTWWAYLAYGILFGFGVWRVHLFQKSRILKLEKERARHRELAHAKEIEKAYNELELTHNDLKATQAQLIQSGKMASLGELTAGIAHEIQNPLNFVNNFSEINIELLKEFEEEIDNGDLEEVKAITKDLITNEEKINHHGKRADAIVKGMLQHSRTSSGEKVPTDLNELADEYLRLAYHGLRAKDPDFNAAFETKFDPKLPKVNVIPQDIGRVLLNLINNAFQAVHEMSKLGKDGYAAKIAVSTALEDDRVVIRVKDNGPGIPDDIKDKIFQPFFTTKPTGQGTGLGLSLSYDIVKAHAGELILKSEEGNGAEFIIKLPHKN
ncbi:MAG: ATP-binding protein [Saprospiraceae bacterium]|nr:ATP-binding protein [Saprospiraceae bacterium]